MLRAYYGGSFDPVHNGHLAVARAARDLLGAEVALVPARDPPHKPALHADARQRVYLLTLALAQEPGLHVDTRELDRPGPSYTVDTLTQLRAELGQQTPIAWLIGGDALAQLQTWHRWRALFELAHVVAVPRPGMPLDTASLRGLPAPVREEVTQRDTPPDALAQRPAGGFCRLPLMTLHPESSSGVRQRIASGQPWQDWVPPAVAAAIERLNLYR